MNQARFHNMLYGGIEAAVAGSGAAVDPTGGGGSVVPGFEPAAVDIMDSVMAPAA